MVKFLKQQMGKAGCNIGDNFIKAVNCQQSVAGGYISGEGVILTFLFLFMFSINFNSLKIWGKNWELFSGT